MPQHQPWPYRARGLGWLPARFIPYEADFTSYQRARDEILQSEAGRAVRLSGGIVGRIAAEIVPDSDVLDGPILMNDIVGSKGDYVFLDDFVSDENLETISGVYHVRVNVVNSDGVAHCSWWPKHQTWTGTGLVGDQWSPRAEKFYQDRCDDLAAKKFDIISASSWRKKLKYTKTPSNLIIGGTQGCICIQQSRESWLCDRGTREEPFRNGCCVKHVLCSRNIGSVMKKDEGVTELRHASDDRRKLAVHSQKFLLWPGVSAISSESRSKSNHEWREKNTVVIHRL